MRLNKLTISIFTFTLVFITGCLEVSVNQPTQVPAGQTVSASVQVVLSADPQIGADDDRRMMFAVNKPTGWVIDNRVSTTGLLGMEVQGDKARMEWIRDISNGIFHARVSFIKTSGL